ncbi:MAG: hypothetical protein K1X88_13060 [Nannocystaceae bacterium]|nr:hypothetical protein [Nannocystaceae bacterium]
MSTTTVSTTMADSSTGDDASGSSTDGSGSTTGTPASCGDGVVDEGEACDDANRVQGDGCNNDCVESGSVRWELLFDAPAGASDCGHDVAANAAGTIAVSGEAANADQSSYDIVVLSIAPDGTVTWSDVYDSISNMESGGGSTDRAYGVAIEDDDEIIVAGHEFLDNVDAENVWVRKYDDAGGTVWTRTGPDTHTGRGYGVSVSDAGDVFVVGTHGLYAFVTKYNTNGVEYWTQERKGTDGCNGCDLFWRARPTDDGGVIVSGSYDNMDADAAIVRMDGDGNDVWDDVIDSNMDNDGFGGITAIGEDTLVIGSFAGGAQPDELYNYDPDGNVNWTLSDPVPMTGYTVDVVGTADGGFTVLNHGYDDALGYVGTVTRFDADGAILWQRSLPVPDIMVYQELRAIAVDGDGNFAVTGCRTGDSGDDSDVYVLSLAP